MIKISNHKKGVMIGVIASLVLVVTLGVTFAIYNYSKVGENQLLVTGDIYMKYTETNQLTIEDAMPRENYIPEKYFQFTVEGTNTYKEDIWYEIVLSHGADHSTRTERIRDGLLKFRLVEVKDEVETELINNASYGDLTSKKIYVDKIAKGTKDKITKTYRLYMWVSDGTVVGNTEDKDYDMETWNNQVYASIKVSVNGDFNSKEIDNSAVGVIKNTLGSKGGVIGVTNDSKPTKVESKDIREYRYSGPEVNNYIYFNCDDNTTYEDASSKCELWRIVGIFKYESEKEHLKIVRNDALNGIFPETYKIDNVTYSIKNSDFEVYWNYNKELEENSSFNDWATAGLQYWLNTSQDETVDTPNKGYLSTLKGNSESMIETAKYYLGALTYNNGVSDTPKEAYKNERAVDGCEGQIGPTDNNSKSNVEENETCRVWTNNKAIWEGKIGLLYPSDYGFSVSNNSWDIQLKNFDNIKSLSWLDSVNRNTHEWFISTTSDHSHSVAYWYFPAGAGGRNNYGGNRAVRPTLFLKSDVKIKEGNGSQQQPYLLSF